MSLYLWARVCALALANCVISVTAMLTLVMPAPLKLSISARKFWSVPDTAMTLLPSPSHFI